MKHIFLFLYAAIAAILLHNAACQKNGTEIVEPPVVPVDTSYNLKLGTVKVKKNGVDWTATYTSHWSQTIESFSFSGKIANGGYEESFNFRDIPPKSGVYQLEFWPNVNSLFPNQIPSCSFVYLYDLDEPAGGFVLDTLRNDHFIEVTRFDSINNTVEGRFQVFLRFSPGSPHNPYPPDLPDTISMTEGRFHLKVQD
jgi:hypothetical protein